jgi:hypothetical protein
VNKFDAPRYSALLGSSFNQPQTLFSRSGMRMLASQEFSKDSHGAF